MRRAGQDTAEPYPRSSCPALCPPASAWVQDPRGSSTPPSSPAPHPAPCMWQRSAGSAQARPRGCECARWRCCPRRRSPAPSRARCSRCFSAARPAWRRTHCTPPRPS
eukprot:3417497-Rhodomonas_salina.2